MKKFWLLVSAALMAAALTVSAFAADPLLSIDFADGDNGMELVEAEIVNDATRGKVLEVNGQGPSTNGTSYAVLKTDVFKNTNWDNGLTVNLWVKAAEGSTTLHGTAPLFSLDIANVGYIGMVSSLEAAINTDGNDTSLGIAPRIWCDPADVGGAQNMLDEGAWTYISLVFCEDHIELYVNGELYTDKPFTNGNTSDMSSMMNLFMQLEEVYSIRLGSWLCSWWNYGDFEGMIDDVTVYNAALSADEISALYTSTQVEAAPAAEEPAVEEPAVEEPAAEAPAEEPAAEEAPVEEAPVEETVEAPAAEETAPKTFDAAVIAAAAAAISLGMGAAVASKKRK